MASQQNNMGGSPDHTNPKPDTIIGTGTQADPVAENNNIHHRPAPTLGPVNYLTIRSRGNLAALGQRVSSALSQILCTQAELIDSIYEDATQPTGPYQGPPPQPATTRVLTVHTPDLRGSLAGLFDPPAAAAGSPTSAAGALGLGPTNILVHRTRPQQESSDADNKPATPTAGPSGIDGAADAESGWPVVNTPSSLDTCTRRDGNWGSPSDVTEPEIGRGNIASEPALDDVIDDPFDFLRPYSDDDNNLDDEEENGDDDENGNDDGADETNSADEEHNPKNRNVHVSDAASEANEVAASQDDNAIISAASKTNTVAPSVAASVAAESEATESANRTGQSRDSAGDCPLHHMAEIRRLKTERDDLQRDYDNREARYEKQEADWRTRIGNHIANEHKAQREIATLQTQIAELQRAISTHLNTILKHDQEVEQLRLERDQAKLDRIAPSAKEDIDLLVAQKVSLEEQLEVQLANIDIQKTLSKDGLYQKLVAAEEKADILRVENAQLRKVQTQSHVPKDGAAKELFVGGMGLEEQIRILEKENAGLRERHGVPGLEKDITPLKEEIASLKRVIADLSKKTGVAKLEEKIATLEQDKVELWERNGREARERIDAEARARKLETENEQMQARFEHIQRAIRGDHDSKVDNGEGASLGREMAGSAGKKLDSSKDTMPDAKDKGKGKATTEGGDKAVGASTPSGKGDKWTEGVTYFTPPRAKDDNASPPEKKNKPEW